MPISCSSNSFTTPYSKKPCSINPPLNLLSTDKTAKLNPFMIPPTAPDSDNAHFQECLQNPYMPSLILPSVFVLEPVSIIPDSVPCLRQGFCLIAYDEWIDQCYNFPLEAAVSTLTRILSIKWLLYFYWWSSFAVRVYQPPLFHPHQCRNYWRLSHPAKHYCSRARYPVFPTWSWLIKMLCSSCGDFHNEFYIEALPTTTSSDSALALSEARQESRRRRFFTPYSSAALAPFLQGMSHFLPS